MTRIMIILLVLGGMPNRTAATGVAAKHLASVKWHDQCKLLISMMHSPWRFSNTAQLLWVQLKSASFVHRLMHTTITPLVATQPQCFR